ncbi:MAG TPA: hypothetical protein PK567_07925, partial [Bacillota bacterium]|nr:hypothetical protein [Bacillota bacterium]
FELPDALMTPLQEYLVHCAEKGNRQSTIDYKHWICNRFLKNLLELGCTKIKDMTGDHVQAAFLALGAIRYWERIGPFLRFLADSNYLKQNYSGLIQHRRHPMPQPTVYSPEEISSVEGSFDLCSPAGIRNYAITLLMSRYGIRACDVAALTFDNIDFDNNRLRFIQQKTDDPWEGELFPEIKSALQRYINDMLVGLQCLETAVPGDLAERVSLQKIRPDCCFEMYSKSLITNIQSVVGLEDGCSYRLIGHVIASEHIAVFSMKTIQKLDS